MRILTVLRRKFKEKCGFTLSETLLTTLILLMVSAVVAGGVPAAANAYYKIIDAANAQLLLSNTIMRLRSELAVAAGVSEAESDPTSGSDPADTNDLITYTSGNSGWTKTLKNSDEGIKTKETSKDGAYGGGEQLLVQKKMTGAIKSNVLITSCESIEYNKTNGVFTVKNLKVTKGTKDGLTLAEVKELVIQDIIPKFSEQEKG